ncbi:TatD DNase family Scn1 [Cyathus striatus]|nr:TatD DNase family Scn1 [Cyathus striatus]
MTNLPLPPDSVLSHIVDVHCHPTDAPSISTESMQQLKITVCAMSTMPQDQHRVRDLASAYPKRVIPCFGYHPWFSYLIKTGPTLTKEEHYRSLFLNSKSQHIEVFDKLLSSLPDPIPLDVMLTELRQNLLAFPNAMLGEVGLDRTFRVPFDYFAIPRVLTPFIIPLGHQISVLAAQIDLAVELGRNISIHSVKSQLATTTMLSDMQRKHGASWLKISVDMHSCGLSSETWRDIERKHVNAFLSLSTVINGRHPNHRSLIACCSPDRLLAESDYNNIDQVTEQTWSMICTIAEVKGWKIEDDWDDDIPNVSWGVVKRLDENWKRFKNGHHQSYDKTGKRQGLLDSSPS